MNNGKKDYTFEDLIGIIKILRGENGCPWDRVQTHESIKTNLIEEAYEAVEALDSGDKDAFADELGDVLLQVVFHAQIGESEHTFTLTDVLNHVCGKMISRHSHIFGSDKASTPDEVLDVWEQRKRKEKGILSVSESMRGVCSYLPSPMRAQKVLGKAEKEGLDQSELPDALARLRTELDLLEDAADAGDTAKAKERLGDLMLAAVRTARLLDAGAEEQLKLATDRLIARCEQAEALAAKQGKRLADYSPEERDALLFGSE